MAAPTRPSSTPRSSKALVEVGRIAGKRFGDAANPLLVSVRSGARASMPGMMDTVLNLGLNDVTVEAVAEGAGRCALRLGQLSPLHPDVFGRRARASTISHFEEILEGFKESKGYALDTDLTADDWRGLVARYKALVEEELGKPFPQDPSEQLWGAIGAVFSSWMNARAITYRQLHDIPESWGTAVNVQAMVFGNMGETSATGVAFTRNPSTGENALYGEFLINAQGEDVVAGIRTPQDITEAARIAGGSTKPSHGDGDAGGLRRVPAHHAASSRRITATCRTSSSPSRRRLWMLQTRSGKRTAKAALRIAVEMAQEAADHPGRGGRRASIPPRSTSSCTRPSIRRRERDVIATRPAGLAWRRIGRDRLHLGRRRGAEGGRPQASSWCASRPAPRTSTACMPPKAS